MTSRENQYIARHQAWLDREARRLAEIELANMIRDILCPVVPTDKAADIVVYREYQYPNEPNGGTS